MRSALLPAIALAAVLGTPALAQTVPPGANPATGARPGNDIGTGMSMPMGSTASNIDR
jgi:hypothetical protein